MQQSTQSLEIVDYPFPNELFLSDHCSCLETLSERSILGVVNVAWSPSRIPSNNLFVRQQYLTHNDEFVHSPYLTANTIQL